MTKSVVGLIHGPMDKYFPSYSSPAISFDFISALRSSRRDFRLFSWKAMRSDYVICKIRFWKMVRKSSPRVFQSTRYDTRPTSRTLVGRPIPTSVTLALPPPATCLTTDYADDRRILSSRHHFTTPNSEVISRTNRYGFVWNPPQKVSAQNREQRLPRRQLPQEMLIEVRHGEPPPNFYSSMETVTLGIQQSGREMRPVLRSRRWST